MRIRPISPALCTAVLVSVLACDTGPKASVAVTSRDTLIIDGTTPTCATCSIEVVSATRIGSDKDRDIPQRVPSFLRDSRGTTYLVFNEWVNKPILRYDAEGHYLGKLGGYGQGPGEYTMTMSAFISPDDSVFVFGDGGRGQVFAPDGKFARVVSLKGLRPVGVTADADRTMFATRGSKWPPDSSAPYLLRVRPDGTIRDSFPTFATPSRVIGRVEVGGSEHPMTIRMETVPALAPDGSVWTYMQSNYRLEHHDRTGMTRQLIGVMLPDVDGPIMTAADADSVWKARESAGNKVVAVKGKPRVRPVPQMSAHVGSGGLLWITRIVPAPRWDTITVKVDHFSPDEAPEETTIPRDIEDRLYHTMVEVIDPVKGQLLARRELPFKGVGVGAGLVGRVTADGSGAYVVSMYLFELRRP
jgi:hypothetical protein